MGVRDSILLWVGSVCVGVGGALQLCICCYGKISLYLNYCITTYVYQEFGADKPKDHDVHGTCEHACMFIAKCFEETVMYINRTIGVQDKVIPAIGIYLSHAHSHFLSRLSGYTTITHALSCTIHVCVYAVI